MTLTRWWDAVSFDGPLAYGEGAVVHAGQLVARGLDPYGPPAPGTFVGGNYGPLGYAVVALGMPFGTFTPLRFVGVLAMLALALTIAWRARASWLAALALGASFLAFFPVQAWGPLVRVDPLAVSLTAFAILVAGERWPRAAASGALAALALAAKPTAVFPIVAVLGYLWWRERRTALRVTASVVVSGIVVLSATLARFDAPGLVTHLIQWNVLPYSVATVALLLAVAAASFGGFAVLGARLGDGRMRAYIVGALLVVVLGGREGATINYLLDLATASCLALAARARADRPLPAFALSAQLAVALALTLFGVFSTTGAWADRQRVALAADLPRTAPHLAEDSGVLLANGIEPVVDDIFLWSHLVSMGVIGDEITPRVRDGEFASVIAEVPLDRLDEAPDYERQRWTPALVRAVLGSYRLEVAASGHYRYVPRRAFALE